MKNVCEVQEFEYTSTQKFVSQFISPRTPYNGMLLYHGVGVGKTCSAVLAAEAFLELSPQNKVYIIAPPAIHAGFERTIFDFSRVKYGREPNEPNQHEGCTGNLYLELSQTLYERDPSVVETQIKRLIHKRYTILGYLAFRNYAREQLSQIPASLSAKKKKQQESKILKRLLSGSFLIIDEAHNLSDVSDVSPEDDAADDVGGEAEKSDASGGKKLSPFLRQVLKTCDGIKLLLMSATPMYNTYKEVVNLLNLLILADHCGEIDPTKTDDENGLQLLSESDIRFDAAGNLMPESEARLVKIANGHVSYMRGENPKAFPVRMDPPAAIRVTAWPRFAPNGTLEIKPDTAKTDAIRLPLVKCDLNADSLSVIQHMTETLVAAKGVGILTRDTLLQAGNIVYPGDGLEGRAGAEGFSSWFQARAIAATFTDTKVSSLPQYQPATAGADYKWMATGAGGLNRYSPKFNQVIENIKKSTGIAFVYSRFVESGAVIFCLALEANGYTAWGRSVPLFSKGVVTPGGRQCAKCDKREAGHAAHNPATPESFTNHKFTPAYYALVTASDVTTMDQKRVPLSPNNRKVVSVARDTSNADGSKIKVVVGSQVAGEGLDFRAIRGVHILEGWFHLAKQEQIVGRGIRYCSHQILDRKERNCTIYAYVNAFPPTVDRETIDLYTYRTAMSKAVQVGHVSRAIKMGAADCNLNRDAISVSGLTPVDMVDNQRNPIRVDLNDRDYTSVCDWIKCNYECKPTLAVRGFPTDDTTYDTYAARFAEQGMMRDLIRLFERQVWYRWEDLTNIFPDVPKSTLTGMLLKAVNNPSVVLRNGEMTGHLAYRNNLFLFQPSSLQDQAVPLALRYGRYPVKRDSYEPERFAAPAAPMIAPAAVKPGVVAEPPAAPVAGAPAEVPGLLPGVEEDEGGPEEVIAPVAAPAAPPINLDAARKMWQEAVRWVDSWAKAGASAGSIKEEISATLSTAILEYADRDAAKRENIENRLKRLQWWGRTIVDVPDGIKDLNKVAKEFIWDSFLKPKEQIGLLGEEIASAEEVGGEQIIRAGAVKAYRYYDPQTKVAAYICDDGAPCPPSILQIFTASKTDPVITARADQTKAASLYGFMVAWEGGVMFKTNKPKAVGKDPDIGAACAISSNVSGHRKKLVEIGDMLAGFSGGRRFDLTEEALKGPRKLTGAIAFCSAMEIILRWMDTRRATYGGLRYFYRPLASFYSKHRSSK